MSRVEAARGMILDLRDKRRAFHRRSTEVLEMETRRASTEAAGMPKAARLLGHGANRCAPPRTGAENARARMDTVRRSTTRTGIAALPVVQPAVLPGRRVICDVGMAVIDGGGTLKRSGARKPKTPSHPEGDLSLDPRPGRDRPLRPDAGADERPPELPIYGLGEEPEEVSDVPIFDFDDPNQVVPPSSSGIIKRL
jgi:hypothetical protein